MTTREKVTAIIDPMSEAELQAQYEHLTEATEPEISDEELDRIFGGLERVWSKVRQPVDAVQLIRDIRDDEADRGLWTE